MIAHWNACKSTSPTAYPKELEETTWLAQLAEQVSALTLMQHVVLPHEILCKNDVFAVICSHENTVSSI
jgi:hypothetical protein